MRVDLEDLRLAVYRSLASTGSAPSIAELGVQLRRLASRWYEGRLERGYQRRDPATAAAYFRSVGLTGPFWDPTPPS